MVETFLPRVAYLAQHDPAAGLRLIWRSLSTLIVGAALSLFLLVLGPYIIIWFFGAAFAGAIPIVRAMSVIPILLNLNMCTSNLYMFNYGHERAWSSLTVSALLVFLTVAYLLMSYLSNAAMAVAVAIIVKEFVVLVVSAGFFLAFGSARTRASRPETEYECNRCHDRLHTTGPQCTSLTFAAINSALNVKCGPYATHRQHRSAVS